MKNFKKVIATISVITLIAINTNFMANATNIVATAALDWTIVTGQTITVTAVGSEFTDTNEITKATIKNLDWTATANATTFTYGWVNGTDTTSVLTIATWDLVDDTTYIITFNTANGDAGAFQISVGTPTDTSVQVSATVEPILKMDFANTALDLGILSTVADTYTAQTITITTATNAKAGLTVTMTSAGLEDSSIDREIWVTGQGGSTDTTATDYYKIQSNANGTGATIVDTNGVTIFEAAGTDMLATQAVIPNTGVYALPHNDTVTTVSISARADTTTDAGNYSDTLVFSVTGTY